MENLAVVEGEAEGSDVGELRHLGRTPIVDRSHQRRRSLPQILTRPGLHGFAELLDRVGQMMGRSAMGHAWLCCVVPSPYYDDLDWYGSYSSGTQRDPTGPASGTSCIVRLHTMCGFTDPGSGFRVVRRSD